MAAAPLVIATDILDIYPDPVDPETKTTIDWVYRIINAGPVPLEEQGSVSFLNTNSKAQVKSAINAVMIASVAAKGYTLTASRIWTIADIAG